MYYSVAFLTFFLMSGININESQSVSYDADRVGISTEKAIQKPKKKMVNINGLRGKYTVKVGQQLKYSASVHGSVGYSASVKSSDNEALPLAESFIEYDDKKRAKMPGGDAATKYFIFDAKKAGKYKILASHYFRGDLERDYTIVITVEE